MLKTSYIAAQQNMIGNVKRESSAMLKISYIAALVLLLTLTLASTSSYVLFRILDLTGVPTGFKNVAALILVLPFIGVIILKRERSDLFSRLFSVMKLWIPWIIYLGISGAFSSVGIWKFEMYVVKIVVPCTLFGIMALANPRIFEKYFMNTLLFLSIFITMMVSVTNIRFDTEWKGVDDLIWLSRAFGINILYMVVTGGWKKRWAIAGPLLVAMFITMIVIGSRGPVISLIIALWIYYALKLRKNVAAAIVSVIGAGILIFLFLNVGFLTQALQSFATHQGEIKHQHFAADRLSAYQPTLQIFSEHPVEGVGLGRWWSVYLPRYVDRGSTAYISSAYKRMRGEMDYGYPHSIVLEIMSELGLIGVVLFMLLFLPYRRLFSLSNPYNILLLLGFLYALSSSDITQNSAPMIFNLFSVLKAKELLSLPGA
jgi:O-antigen ligase